MTEINMISKSDNQPSTSKKKIGPFLSFTNQKFRVKVNHKITHNPGK